MSKLVRVCVVTILALLPSAARAAEALTLEEALKLALANNERALKAPLRIDVAEGQLDRARAAFLPSLTAGLGGTLRPTDDKTPRAIAGNTTFALTQPIFNLSAFPLYAQARHQLESERWGATQDKRLVAFDTARSFLVALTNERLLDAATRRLERAKANQQNAEARAQAQLASVNDATRATLDAAGASRDVVQAQATLARSYLALGFLVGKAVAGPLTPPDRTIRAAENAVFRPDDLIKLAEARRPDLRSAKERTASLREAAREPLYRLAPSLAAQAQIRVTIAPLPQEKLHDESVQLTLNWTLYDAGTRYGDRRSRLAQAESQALDERALKRSIAVDVGTQLVTIRAARESFRISNDAVAAAHKNTAETEALYTQGLARAIELIDANAKRFEAEVGRETARLAMEQAYLELRFVLGLDPLGGELDSPAVPAPADDKDKPKDDKDKGAQARPAEDKRVAKKERAR